MLKIPFNLNGILIHLMFDRETSMNSWNVFAKPQKIHLDFVLVFPRR
jgi:hypothetical protein